MTALIIICIVFGLLFFSVFGNIIKLSRETDDLYAKLEKQEQERAILGGRVAELNARVQGLTGRPEPTGACNGAVYMKNAEEAEHFKKNVAFPYIIDNYGKLSQRDMAKYLNVSRSNIRNWIKKLQKAGRIQQSTNDNEGSEVRQ